MSKLKAPLPTWVALVGVLVAVVAIAAGSALAGGGKTRTAPGGEKGNRDAPASARGAGAQISQGDSFDAGNFRYVIEYDWLNTAGTQDSGEAACPQSYRATGGGVLAFGDWGLQNVNSTYPVDDAELDTPNGSDSDDAPDDGWVAYVDNFGSTSPDDDQTFDVYVICRKRGSG